MASKTTGFTPNWGLLPPPFRRRIVLINPAKATSNEKEIKAAGDYLIEYFNSFHQQTNINHKRKSMITNLMSNSLKAIRVPDYLFELIANHQVVATHLTAEQEHDLREKPTFLVVCGDTAISCEVITLSKSRINNQTFYAEFKANKEVNT